MSRPCRVDRLWAIWSRGAWCWQAGVCGPSLPADADQPVRAPGRAVLLAEVPGVVGDRADDGQRRGVPACLVPGGDDLLRGGDAGQRRLYLGGVAGVLGGAGAEEQAVIGPGELAVIGLHGAVAGAVHRAGIRIGDVAHRPGRFLVPLPLALPGVPARRALPGSRFRGRGGPGPCGLPGRGQPFPAAPHRRGLLRRDGTGAAHAAPGGGRHPLVIGIALSLLRGGRLLQRDLRDRDRGLGRYPARRRLPGPRLRQVGFRLLPACRILRRARGPQVRQGRRPPLGPGRPPPPAPPPPRAAPAGPQGPGPGSTPPPPPPQPPPASPPASPWPWPWQPQSPSAAASSSTLRDSFRSPSRVRFASFEASAQILEPSTEITRSRPSPATAHTYSTCVNRSSSGPSSPPARCRNRHSVEWSGNWFPDATRKPASVRVRSSISREARSPHDIAYITSVASICGSYPGRPRPGLVPACKAEVSSCWTTSTRNQAKWSLGTHDCISSGRNIGFSRFTGRYLRLINPFCQAKHPAGFCNTPYSLGFNLNSGHFSA